MRTLNPVICWALVTLFVSSASAETVARSEQQEPSSQASDDLMKRLQQEYLDAHQKAQATGEAPEGMGFLKPDSNMLPDAVKKTVSSVFSIAVPEGDLVKVTDLFGNLSLANVARKIQARPESAELEAVDKAIFLYQINECIRQKVRDCRIFDGISYGTAFVTGDGRDLRTALHVVQNVSKQARAQRASGKIPVFILDSKRRVVFGPHNLTATVAATYKGALDTSVHEGKEVGRFNLDQVLIRLDKPIAHPIPIADRPLSEGDPAFIVGVPKKTEDRAFFNALDSDGKTTRISRGTTLGATSLMERLEKTGFYLTLTTTSQMLREATAVTADGAPRMSGGAILNAKGEVVGVYTSGLPESGTVYPSRVSYGGNALIQP